MKIQLKIYYIFLVLICNISLNAQTFRSEFNEGKRLFENKDYYQAYLHFNGAKALTDVNGNKTNIKIAEKWINKAVIGIQSQKQLAEKEKAKSDSLLADAKRKKENARKVLFYLMPELPKEGEKIAEFFVKRADSLCNFGNFKEAAEVYSLAEFSGANNNMLKKIKQKKEVAEDAAAINNRALNCFYKRKYDISKQNFDTILVNLPNNYYAKRMSQICLPYKEQTLFFDTIGNKRISKYEISNIEFCRFLNDSENSFVFTKGKYRAYTIYNKNSKFLNNEGNVYEKETGAIYDKYYKYVDVGRELEPITNISRYAAKSFCDYYNIELPDKKMYKKIKKYDTEWIKEEQRENDGITSNSIGKCFYYPPHYTLNHISFRIVTK